MRSTPHSFWGRIATGEASAARSFAAAAIPLLGDASLLACSCSWLDGDAMAIRTVLRILIKSL